MRNQVKICDVGNGGEGFLCSELGENFYRALRNMKGLIAKMRVVPSDIDANSWAKIEADALEEIVVVLDRRLTSAEFQSIDDKVADTIFYIQVRIDYHFDGRTVVASSVFNVAIEEMAYR